MVASVLSVAGGPAQAANTAAEELKDTNADGTPDARLFAGSHRYETAEMLARRFADLESGVSSVIIANGESQVDAVAAAGLAGSRNAPVLLTRPASLPHNVARFVSDQNVTNVTIVGGTAAVSAAVETALKGLASKPTVTRIMGANRFATAAMIGDSLGGPNATWCGSSQRAAILVNGRDAGMSDAVVAGPLAYRLGLPVLLTEADELPAETRKFLTDNQIGRVVVVGDATAVSAGVINTLTEEVGVANAPRISGANAAATSVAVAKEMRGACKDELNVDPDRVALLNSTATADGIAAAPVLGRGLAAGGGSVPILLVGSALPAEVREFLATTPNTRAGNKTHMNVVAVGGKAVVTDAVMTAAVEAATTGGDLTAKISFKVDPAKPATSRQFTVTFSDAVNTDPVSPTNPDTVLNPDLYRINGRRLSAATPNTDDDNPDEGVRKASSLLFTGNTVTVTLGADNADTSAKLKTGDKIEVVGGAQVGANEDKRKLKETSLTVTVPDATSRSADTAAPALEILAVGGETWVDVIIKEDNLLMTAGGTSPYRLEGGVDIIKCPTCSESARIKEVLYLDLNNAALGRPGSDGNGKGFARFTFDLEDRPGGGSVDRLQVGDVIEVKRGTFLDTNNRGNRLIRYTVQVPKARPTITGVSIGNKFPTEAATIELATAADNAVANKLSVTAKQAGIAGGSSGNGWKIFGYALPTAQASKPVDIDVDVDAGNKIIAYTVRNGAPTVDDMGRAFERDAAFQANFTFDYTDPAASGNPAPTAAFGTVSSAPRTLAGGKSAVGLRVDFSAVIEDIAQAEANWLAAQLMGESTLPSGVEVTHRFGDRNDDSDRSAWLAVESAELTATTKLPTRSDTVVIPANSDIESYHADTGCGPFGRNTLGSGACPDGLQPSLAVTNNLAPSFIRGMRLDASLKVCIVKDSGGNTQAAPCIPAA